MSSAPSTTAGPSDATMSQDQQAQTQHQTPKPDTTVASGPGTDDLVPDEVASPTKAADAKRAMSAAAAWKPAMDRRQSWDAQEHKREMMMTRISDVQEGPGFSESK